MLLTLIQYANAEHILLDQINKFSNVEEHRVDHEKLMLYSMNDTELQ